MSGIFGIVQLDGRPLQSHDLESMRDALAHRGPDGGSIWVGANAGLGQLMLHTTPESLHENLPRYDPKSGLVITADARIDNRADLLASLSLTGADSRDLPDSQIILAAFLRWGSSCAEHLLGDFSFVIWDAQRRKLFCARDHMGIRPLYYYQSGKLLVFASSAQAVVSTPLVPERISDERVADFLVGELEGVNNRCTFFQDVWRLPPAHTAEFSDLGFRVHFVGLVVFAAGGS